MRVAVSIIVTKPADTLFWLSQDYARRLEWDIYLDQAYLLHGHSVAGVGVSAFCRNRSGTVLISRYISFAPPTHAAVEMTDGPWLLRQFGGTWRFKALPDGSTEVRFIYNFKTRGGWFSYLLEPLVGLFYRHDMQRRLGAFKRWAEAMA